ncbi:class I SAM-dependent RNA methyltransferase [Williamsia sp. CHRR-6]|uniref:class I SAM-dependent RNA methyltransferase n=1 Tax=Williamsia sp. CHRR-6 TaxID=2835871 RepID=UPI001BDA1557|nr:TRAM domain-containing protein [Williamsia sp. CHRR-6]MBT0567951.1 class I SAM-dependent RNA methyltransferase [Williamsia sp. CHRR-6]
MSGSGWQGSSFELADLRPANGGEMVGRHEGRAVFVRGALPGERVRVRVTEDRAAAYCRATVTDVLAAAPTRIEPRCAAAASGAGCCDLSFVSDAGAAQIKSQVLHDVLTRIGGLSEQRCHELIAPLSILGESTGWRTRTRLAVDADGNAGVRAHGSDAVVTVACAQPVDGLLDGIAESDWTPGTELVAVRDDDGRHHVAQLQRPHDSRRGSGRGARDRRGRAQQARAASARRTPRVVIGSSVVCQRVGDQEWQLPITSFWQAHTRAPEFYSAAVRRAVTQLAPAARTAWDLYGGVGVFAAALRAQATELERVVLVESDPAAAGCAQNTFADDARIIVDRAPVAQRLRDLPPAQVVICDPPRTGVGAQVVAGICAAAPDLVVHIGCDVATFARDLRAYASAGYQPVGITPVDAFPLTHHLEVIAVLRPAHEVGPTTRSGDVTNTTPA